MFGSILGKLMPASPESDSSDSDTQILLSIERSRKRNLSPGLLRGDKVADCLKIQELSASPSLKKLRPDPVSDDEEAPAEDMLTQEYFTSFMNTMRTEVNGRLDGLDGGLSQVRDTVEKLNANVSDNNTKLDNHKKLIQDNADSIKLMQGEMEKIKARSKTFADAAAGPVPGPSGVPRSQPTPPPQPAAEVTDVEGYNRARRSLRIWPIPGTTRKDLWAAAGNFIKVTLGHPQLTESMIELICRPDVPSGPASRLEVLVRFRDVEFRDAVMGSSNRLAEMIDDQGRPTAGIRIEVTPTLRPALKTLERFGQQLRSRHGQGTKRHFKFDDLERSLYLNIKLPGDLNWTRVTLDVARRGLVSRERFTSEELEKRLDINGPHTSRQRPASTSSAPDRANLNGRRQQ